MTSNVDLCGQWSLTYGAAPNAPLTTIAELRASGLPTVAATVPGNFELDLHAAGVIDDPFFGMNIARLREWEHTHLWFSREFEAPPVGEAEPFLVFEGLDCFADIFLNGQLVGIAGNMLVEWRFPVEGMLGEDNELVVHIRPAFEVAKQYSYGPGVGAMDANYESLHVRKAPHMFGWDIMPRALSGGIWRPATLVYEPRERLETLYLATKSVSASRADLLLYYEARLQEKPGDRIEIEVEGRCGESTFRARKTALFEVGRLPVAVESPRLWWPRGRGEQALYAVEVRLLRNGEVLDRRELRHGIRTVNLKRGPSRDPLTPGEFCFEVNGEPLYVMGSNWVPADAFHSRDRERIPRMLQLAEECGCNMLRCWGGNVYEDDRFYDLCDEKGILVWQDFAMACALYPQDDSFAARLADEVKRVVRRLRRHPCLALWAGDNECDEAYEWFRGAHGDPNQNRLTRQVIPGVLANEDPFRPYLPSSPYVDAELFRNGKRNRPEDHLWGPRDHYKSPYYAESACRFASEIGYHGCPSPDSIRRFISPDNLWPPFNDEWTLHSTSPVPGVDLFDYRVNLVCNQVRALFGDLPDNLEDFAWQSQVVQAEAFKYFIELFRMGKWRRTGMIWWNLIDGWPQISDAVVDYYFTKKLAFDHIAASQRPLCLMLREPGAWRQELVACNDLRTAHTVHFAVRDADSGEVVAQGSGLAQADAVTGLAAFPHLSNTHRFFLIEWESELGRGLNHYLLGAPPFRPDDLRRWYSKLAEARAMCGSVRTDTDCVSP